MAAALSAPFYRNSTRRGDRGVVTIRAASLTANANKTATYLGISSVSFAYATGTGWGDRTRCQCYSDSAGQGRAQIDTSEELFLLVFPGAFLPLFRRSRSSARHLVLKLLASLQRSRSSAGCPCGLGVHQTRGGADTLPLEGSRTQQRHPHAKDRTRALVRLGGIDSGLQACVQSRYAGAQAESPAMSSRRLQHDLQPCVPPCAR